MSMLDSRCKSSKQTGPIESHSWEVDARELLQSRNAKIADRGHTVDVDARQVGMQSV
jgi:hypothetical protein